MSVTQAEICLAYLLLNSFECDQDGLVSDKQVRSNEFDFMLWLGFYIQTCSALNRTNLSMAHD